MPTNPHYHGVMRESFRCTTLPDHRLASYLVVSRLVEQTRKRGTTTEGPSSLRSVYNRLLRPELALRSIATIVHGSLQEKVAVSLVLCLSTRKRIHPRRDPLPPTTSGIALQSIAPLAPGLRPGIKRTAPRDRHAKWQHWTLGTTQQRVTAAAMKRRYLVPPSIHTNRILAGAVYRYMRI
jgi:hypothetical protein